MLRAIFVLAALPLLAIAGTIGSRADASCSTSSNIHCCNDMKVVDSGAGKATYTMHKDEHSGTYEIRTDTGTSSKCSSPLIGPLSNGQCQGTNVCCDASGLVAVGCVPIIL